MSAEAFLRIHTEIPREGPGSDASTRRALKLLPDLPQAARVLDLGCGPGRQTLVLAAEAPADARIVAVDIHQPYLDRLQRAVSALGWNDRIEIRNTSMDNLNLAPGSVDLLWAEGSAYCLGVETALRLWRPLLAAGGSIGFTELTWLADKRPPEAAEFWAAAYPPDMTDLEGNAARLTAAGYAALHAFPLPSSDWWDEYFTPLLERIEFLREHAPEDVDLGAAIAATEREVEIYRRYGESFGYCVLPGAAPLTGRLLHSKGPGPSIAACIVLRTRAINSCRSSSRRPLVSIGG